MSYTNKTQPTTIDPEAYLKTNFQGKDKLQAEVRELIAFFEKITKRDCVMWNKIFGFGEYFYKDSKGGDHSYLMTGFAISKTGFTLYSMMNLEKYQKDLEKLGKYKITGKSCLAIKTVDDIDLETLEKIFEKVIVDMKKMYKTK